MPSAFSFNRRRWTTAALAGAALSSVSACGFKLRQPPSYVFERLSILPEPGGAVAQQLRRSLGGAVQVIRPQAVLPAASAASSSVLAQPAAQVVLDILQEQREKSVVGVTATGQVREFQLRLRVRFRVRTLAGLDVLAEDELLQSRDISFNESAVLAKEAEEGLLYRDMQNDIVQQLIRRLGSIKTLP